MDIICSKQNLLDAVSNVIHAVSSKSTLPSLEGILLKASGSSLFLAGYDLELGITTTIEADVKKEGSIIITARLFHDILRKSSDSTVHITADGAMHVTIQSGLSEFNLVGISASEYPEIPNVDDGAGIVLAQSLLKSMIDQTKFAIAKTDNRPVHTGTKFEIRENLIRLVSVDGSRLAMRSEQIKTSEVLDFVVPGKTLFEIIKLLKDDDTPVSIAIGRRHIVLEINGYAVISRLLDGEFLPYDKAIPKDHTTEVIINTRDVISAVERASLMISDRIKSPLICLFADDEIKFSCTTPLGSAQDVVSAKIDGEDQEMGINSLFILDALKNTDSDEVKIQLSGALSPMKIVPKEGESFLFLVLPVRLKR